MEEAPRSAMPAGGYRRLLAAVLLFSLNPVLYRQLSLDPFTILSSVNAIAALALVAASACHGRAGQIVALSSGLPAILLLAVCFALNNVLFLTAVQKTTVANATVTHYLAPLFLAVVFAPWLLAEKATRREVLLTIIAFLVPYVAPLPFLFLEVFVGFVQAFIFGMLSLVFIAMATAEHETGH